jgi:hypothetical protein
MTRLGKKDIQLYLIVLFLCFKLFYACSDEINLGEPAYEPKIVIEGYLYPGHRIDNIKITRNIPFNQVVEYEATILTDAKVELTDLSSNKKYILSYNKNNLSFCYESRELSIDYKKSYKLEVWAAIDGQILYAYSITKTPETGLKIEKNETDTIHYRQKDASNQLVKYSIKMHPSKESEIIAVSITAVQPDVSNFIFDNPYHQIDSSDVANDITRYSDQYYSLQNFNPDAEELIFNINWTLIWFYGEYRVIIYAGDKNFKNFFLTQKDLQELDGNFHEPKVDIKGDGIGVFASAVTDTTYFFVKE